MVSSSRIDVLVTQIPPFVEGSDPTNYIQCIVSAIDATKPWMKHSCQIWLRLRDAYLPIQGSSPEYINYELLGLPWKIAFGLQARGFFLNTCLALKPKDLVVDHEYLFFFRTRPLPRSLASCHRADWSLDGDGWLAQILDGSAPWTTFFDPYQNPKIKEFVTKHQRHWLGD